MQHQWLPTFCFCCHHKYHCITLIIYMHTHHLHINPKLKGCATFAFPKLLFCAMHASMHDCRDNKQRAIHVRIWLNVTPQESKIGGREIIDGKHSNFYRASWFLSYLSIMLLQAAMTASVLQYWVGLKGLNVLLSRTQAGPGRAVKQEQEENSRNHVRTF